MVNIIPDKHHHVSMLMFSSMPWFTYYVYCYEDLAANLDFDVDLILILSFLSTALLYNWRNNIITINNNKTIQPVKNKDKF